MYRRIVILTLCVIGTLCIAAAPPQAHIPTPHLVLIGVASYTQDKDKDIIPRPHAETDILALYDLLSKKDVFGADANHTRLLLGTPDKTRPCKQATRKNILETLSWLRDSVNPNDPVIFAFFGAGGPRQGKSKRCYFASDSTIQHRNTDAVSDDDIAATFDKLQSKQVSIFLDVHFKAIKGDKPPEVSLSEGFYREFLSFNDSTEKESRPGRILYMATSGLTAGVDLKDHGLFAQCLLDGLRGGADKEGYEGDGVVTTEELTKWLDKELPRLRREKAPEARRVRALAFGTQGSRFALANEPKAREKVNKQIADLKSLRKDNKLTAELEKEGIALLSQMPRLEHQQSLRKEYQKLVEGMQTSDKLLTARDEINESTEILPEVAKRFALKVVRVAEAVSELHVKKTDISTLTRTALRGIYRHIDEPMPKAVTDKFEKNPKMEVDELFDLLTDVRTRLGKRADLSKHKDIDVALQSMVGSLDAHSTYISPEDVKRFEIETKASYTGVGATISKDETTDYIKIGSPMRNSPAFKAGVQANDLIVKIKREVDSNGKKLEKPEVLDTIEMTTEDATKKILGKAGTKVTLTLRREGKKEPFDIVIERGRVKVESVVGHRRKEDHSWDFMLDTEKKIGYIRLLQFVPDTAKDLKTAVEELRNAGMKSLILDLRFNGGGGLTTARDVSDLFIDDQLIVTIRPRRGAVEEIHGKKAGSQTDFPMVCLINGGSASASEIVSACLQDYERAVICGSRSFGKGSVQGGFPFDGGELNLTIATFHRRYNKNLHKASTSGKEEDEWGVKPDKGFELVLPPEEEDKLAENMHEREVIRASYKSLAKYEDRQLEMALKHLKKGQ